MAVASDHPRLRLRRFLPLDLCKELEFIHRSCGTVGYRPGVFSTTLFHLIATNCAHLILPFIPVREKIKEVVEEFFGCEYELVVEFTGLVSWCKGANIGWHSDDNRPYLKQRDFTAVCYLNNSGTNFEGGILHFKDGEPQSIVPTAGDVMIYTADDRNIHSVDEVTRGERITLTLWFSRDSAHDEDTKLIARLFERLPENLDDYKYYLPSPAASNMYWYSQQQSGFDIRWARMHALGFIFCTVIHEDYYSSSDSSCDPLELSVEICRGDKVYNKEFENSMHALQVVQFYYWKSSELKAEGADGSNVPLLREKRSGEQLVIPCDIHLAEAIFEPEFVDDVLASFNWVEFSFALAAWQKYVLKMHKILSTSISSWKAHQSLFACHGLGENYFNT